MREQERNPSARRVRRRGVSGRVVVAVGAAGALALAAASPAVASRVHGGGDPPSCVRPMAPSAGP